MTSLVLDRDPVASSINVSGGQLIVNLDDGRSLSVPLEWYPRLLNASESERKNFCFWGEGYAVEWPDIDEHISVEGLLAGRRSGECTASFALWLATRETS